MRKIVSVVLLLIVFLSACSVSESIDSEKETQLAEIKNEHTNQNVQNQPNADGYDILGGSWEVGAVCYDGKVVDVHDNDALASLYDNTFLEFYRGGTFTYINLRIYGGDYTRSKKQEDSFILTRNTETNMVNGERKTEAYSGNTKHIIQIIDRNTIEFSEYDPVIGAKKVDESTLIFVKRGKDSDFIGENKEAISNGTPRETEAYTDNAVQSSYASILNTYVQKMERAVPNLVSAYRSEAAGVSDIEHLAQICNSKVEELATICNEGVEKMAELMYARGDSYNVYEKWSVKLFERYTEIALEIQNAYLDSVVP